MDEAVKYPSIQLAFEQVKGVLSYQKHTAETIDSKASTLFAAATAVLGIGVPLAFSRLDSAQIWLLAFVLLPVFAYLIAGVFMIMAHRSRLWRTMDNPIVIEEHFLTLAPDDFMHEILLHTRSAFTENDYNLKAKASAVDRLLIAVVVETTLIALWFTLVFWTPFLSP